MARYVVQADYHGSEKVGHGLFNKAMGDYFHYYVKLRSGEFFVITQIVRIEEFLDEKFVVVELRDPGKYYEPEHGNDWAALSESESGLARNQVAVNVRDIMVFADAGE